MALGIAEADVERILTHGSPKQVDALIGILEATRNWQKTRGKIFEFYPDAGPLRRELYRKHLAFFAAGATEMERAVLAANRVGKTEGCGGYEVALHLTGLYEEAAPWWIGRRWARGINVLCGGDTSTTTRDILVRKLLGPPEARGTGLIPEDRILQMRPAAGIPGAIDYATIKHSSGQPSILQFRSYDQGREAWQGTERDIVWMDEEPPMDIYVEALYRTATTKGMAILTATPLQGVTDVVLSFMPNLKPTAGYHA